MSSSDCQNSSRASAGHIPAERKSDKIQYGNTGDSKFLAIPRQWHNKHGGDGKKPYSSDNGASHHQSVSPLERWQRESVLAQPYHNIAGATMQADPGKSKKISKSQGNNSSVGYYDPKDTA